jgi:hypothetical protein
MAHPELTVKPVHFVIGFRPAVNDILGRISAKWPSTNLTAVQRRNKRANWQHRDRGSCAPADGYTILLAR